MAPGAAHRGLQSLPKELLTRILRMVHEEDVFHHQDLARGRKGVRVFSRCTLLPLRTVSLAWRGAVDDAIRYFTYNFVPSSLNPPEIAQQTLWWGFVLHSLLPRWNHLATVKLVFDWKASYLRFVLHGLQQGCPSLETLFLQADPKDEDSLEDLLLSSGEDPKICTLAPLRNLSSLTLFNFDEFTPQWATGLSSLTALRDLRVESGGFDYLDVPPGLTRLHVDGEGPLQLDMESATGLVDLTLWNSSFEELVVPPTLRSLQLVWLPIRAFALCSLPALTSLHLEHADVGDLSWLSDSSELRVIKLQALEGVTPLPDLSHMSKLTKLCIDDVAELHDLPPLHCLPSLTALKVAGCSVLQRLPRLPPALRTLFLEGWPQLSSMEELVSAPSLTNLKMENCPDLHVLPDLAPLEHLRRVCLSAVGLSSLRGLDMLRNTLRTLHMEDLQELLSLDSLGTLDRLKELRISNCEQLEEVGPLPLPELVYLHLDTCEKVEKVSLCGLPKLEVMCLNGCGATALEGLQELPRLKTLKVSGCLSLARLAMGPGLSSLQSLDLVDCAALKSLVGVSYLPKFAQVCTIMKGLVLQIFASEEVVTAVHRDESDGGSGNSSDEEDIWD